MFASILRKKKTKKRVQPKQSHSFFLANWFGSDIAIDLGTANIIVFVKNRGIVVNEPAVIAVDTMENKVVAIGREAQAMLGRTPRNIHAYHPLRNGVIADYDATEYMLRYFIRKAIGKALIFKPRVVICVPSSVTNVERRAVIEAAMQAGARKTTVMEEPLAAAIGAGLDIATSNGSMVVDMGGGTTDVAVLSLSGVVISESLRIGSNTFDEAIIRYLEKMIKTAVIVSEDSPEDEVGMNNTVDIYFEEDDVTETYKLVTTVRSNSLKNLISRESPLGAAIFGHKVGDRCEVHVNDNYSYFVQIKRIVNTMDDGTDELRKF